MGIEIERRFLVTGDGWREGTGERLLQGYLSLDPERTVRVRVGGGKAFLTIKGATQGSARPEFEYEIPLADASELLRLVEGPLVDKLRYRPRCGDHVWDVDEFRGANEGLVVAEVELRDEAEVFARPDWLGREVTQDRRYANASLVQRPYSTWADVA